MISLLLGAALGAALQAAPPSAPMAAPSLSARSTEPVPVPAVRARGSLPGLFSTDDYPREALFKGEQGTVAFRVVIDPAGRVSECVVTASSGSASLDRTTCAIVQRRARFTPARDARGRAVADSSFGRIRWQLPVAAPKAVEDRISGVVYALGTDGKVAGCRLEGRADAEGAAQACAGLKAMANGIVASGKGRVPTAHRELVIEFGQLVGGSEAALGIGRRGGQTLGSLIAIAVTVDEAGKVRDCNPVESNRAVEQAAWMCKSSLGSSYLPLDPSLQDRSDRHLLIYQAVYLRPAR